MIDGHMDTVRRQLGELGAMSDQTEEMERQILSRAEEGLAKIDAEIDKARADALAGGEEAKSRYTSMVKERGVLQQVIARAREALNPT